MIKHLLTYLFLIAVSTAFANDPSMKLGAPDIQSMGVLEFSPEGILFIGDSKGASVFAVDLQDNNPSDNDKALNIVDIEDQLAAMLGTTSSDIMIHDLAVNPISQNAYLSVSRGRSNWTSNWQLPKELTNAKILIRIKPGGSLEEVPLNNVQFAKFDLPNPVDEQKEHRWKKGAKLRADAISDIAYNNGRIFVAGLSNEEFSSAMWVVDYPFKKGASSTTLEIFHGAHGKYESHSPIRAFLPYEMEKSEHLIAAYLCTPLVKFRTEQFENGKHIKGKTVAEFGSGNFPIDMVLYQNDGKDLILMSNSQLPLMIFDPKDVEEFEGEINTEVKDYLGGVKYTPRSGSAVYHLANYNKNYILATQRLASGKLVLSSLSKAWLIP